MVHVLFREIGDVGKPQIGKVVHLAALIVQRLWCRARTRARVLYYPPAGPDLIPVLRDIAILLCTRWAFPRPCSTSTPPACRDRATATAAAALALLGGVRRAGPGHPHLELNPPDGQRLKARRVAVVANGVRDHSLAQADHERRPDGPPVVLYVGVLRESKGLLTLVEVCRRLHAHGLEFRLHLMGAFESRTFESTLHAAVADAGLEDRTTFLGVRSGDAQAASLRSSDNFCYPSYFESESFGRVLIEAMRFSLPVVATRWRGIPSVVADGENAILVPVRDPAQLEKALCTLLEDPQLRRTMGRRGRELYLERFTEERFRRRMEALLSEL